jgi:hypothetical protein
VLKGNPLKDRLLGGLPDIPSPYSKKDVFTPEKTGLSPTGIGLIHVPSAFPVMDVLAIAKCMGISKKTKVKKRVFIDFS